MTMQLKIATWNMAYWSHKKHDVEAWNYYLNDLGCDILLFQESRPNSAVLDKDGLVWNEIGGSRDWGSGIYSPKYEIQGFPLETAFVGSVTAAEIEVKPELKIIVVSLYGLMETLLNTSYAIPNLHRILSDLTGILEGGATKHRIVIGGDLNASLQIDKNQPTGNSHKAFFNRLKEFGLVNCFDNYFQDFVQTHRHGRSNKPWQNDYFFVSKKLEGNLTNCEVIDTSEVRSFSDHNPVVIELDV